MQEKLRVGQEKQKFVFKKVQFLAHRAYKLLAKEEGLEVNTSWHHGLFARMLEKTPNKRCDFCRSGYTFSI